MKKNMLNSKLKVFENRYLSNIISEIYLAHEELQDELEIKINQAIQDKDNDQRNNLLENADLPMHPDHYTLKDFDPSCLSAEDKENFDKLVNFSFLEARDHPNLIIYGPPNQGKEKLAIGLADHLCKNKHSALYIDFHNLVTILSTHEKLAESNTTYEDLLKIECLIIHNFASQNIYDRDLLYALDVLLQERVDKQISRHNYKWKPHVTYVDTCYPPVDWIKHFTSDQMIVLNIVNKLYGMGVTITVDESNKPKDETNDSDIPAKSKEKRNHIS